jgi:cob(I)alamin adenosyltransferase
MPQRGPCGKRANALPSPGGRGPNDRRRRLCATSRAPRLARVKIYTRTGDDGTTGLLGPGRVLKSDARVEAYGSVDELNAELGVVRSLDTPGWLAADLATIQSRLFSLGAELAATTPEPLAKLVRIADPDIAELERIIDRLDAELPPLKNFVLPAGSALAAQLHLARTVCRRAERRVVALGAHAPLEPRLVCYLNRLADLLFVMARSCNLRAGIAEVEWRAESGAKPDA